MKDSTKRNERHLSRRQFVQQSGLLAAAGTFLGMPTIVPATVLGKNAPSNRINIGMIGTGRQAIGANMNNGFLKLPECRIVAVNDVDSWRMGQAEEAIKLAYKTDRPGVKSYRDYRDLINDPDVDAVMISTPDHWHAPQAVAAALAGKHVCMEKAFTIAPMHGKAVVEAVKARKVANRLDSEFRSNRAMNRAVELVHNGLIGQVKEVVVGVPKELSGNVVGPQKTTPVPAELDYDLWLGPAFEAPYTMQRVHEPKKTNTRPGWLRVEDYCNGMITNWGAHLHDIALWGMKREYELPVSAEGTGDFARGLWNTIITMDITYEYADGLKLHYIMDKPFVKFTGDKGWIQVIYPNDLTASDASILQYQPGPNDISYADTLSDKADFLRSIQTGKPSLEPLEVGYNVYFLTYMGLTSITLGQKVTWDSRAERFVDDNAANAMLTRPFREKWIDRPVADWINKYQSIHL
jgi:predicted dehydrogenase